jgi:predicted metal-dependent hydrolase
MVAETDLNPRRVPNSVLSDLLADYRVRVHPRARHVRLRIDPRDGLVVTIPPRFDRRRLPALLSARSDWIHRVASRQALAKAHMDPACQGRRPQKISLPALGREWLVDYPEPSGRYLRFDDDGCRLIIGLPEVTDEAVDARVIRRLRSWLRGQASEFLKNRTEALSNLYGLGYRSVTIRHQKARWGSCSTRGDLSLNARLLFCPPRACDYVIVHELVHTLYANHSADFWNKVEELMPDFRLQEDVLNQVWLTMPDWV